MSKDTIKGFLFASLGSVSWGISGVCSQYLFMKYDIDSGWLTAYRMLIAGILLLLISFSKDKWRIFQIWKKRDDCVQLLAFSLIGLLMCQYTFLSAIKYSNSATATVFQSLNVVIMGVIMSLWNKTRLSKSQILGIILALTGTYLISTKGNWASMSLSIAGLTFGLLAAVGVVTYTILSRSIILTWGNITITGWGMLIGGFVFFLIAKAWKMPPMLDFFALLMIAVIILIGTVIAFSSFLEGVRYLGPVKATLLGCLEPASATLLSALFLKTQFSMVELIGFCFIILTVVLSVIVKEK